MIDDEPECPECGEPMVIRKNKKTGEAFYGCILFPRCEGTRELRSEPVKQDYPEWAKQ